jgi:hypothetical protein
LQKHNLHTYAQLQAIEERGWSVGAHIIYEQLTDTAEIFHTTKVLEDLIERLQEEGLLRKKVRIST